MQPHNNLYHLPTNKTNSNITWSALLLGLGLSLLTSFIATQYLAYSFGYNEALPGEYISLGNVKLYQPFAWIIWNWQFKDYKGGLEEHFTVAHLIIAIGSFISLMSSIIILYQKSKKAQITYDFHGSARWATKEEIINTGLLNHIQSL